jgi:hypothetical protein
MCPVLRANSMMIRLDKALQAWGRPDFETVLKSEVAQLGAACLPLQQGLSGSNYVADVPVTPVIHGVVETGNAIRIRAGIFYQGIIGGCNCADDPGPSGEINEYCEVQIEIDKATATAKVILITDESNPFIGN